MAKEHYQERNRETRKEHITSLERRVWGVVSENDLEFDHLLTMTSKELKALHGVGKLLFDFIWTTYRTGSSGSEALHDLSARVNIQLENKRAEQPRHVKITPKLPSEIYLAEVQESRFDTAEKLLSLIKQKGVSFGSGLTKTDIAQMSHEERAKIIKQLEALSDVEVVH